MTQTAELELDTAVAEAEAPLLDEAPETDGADSAPETEGDESSENSALDENDPRVQELIAAKIKDAEARIGESYRRRQEHSERQARIAAYEESRRVAESAQVDRSLAEITKMVKAVEEGSDADFDAIKNHLLTQRTAGLVDVLEGMEAWANSFLRREAPTFFASVSEDDPLNLDWLDAKAARDPGRLMAVALKAAAAAGEQKGREAAKAEFDKEAKTRANARAKTEQVREASAARTAQGRPTSNLSGPAPKSMTLAEIEAMPMNQWLAMPQQERQRLLERARA